MNVSELLRKVRMTREELFPLAKELGFDIGERAIKIDERVAQKLIRALQQHRGNSQKRSLFADEKVANTEEVANSNTAEKRCLEISEQTSVKELADKLGKQVTEMIAILMQQGIMATINQKLDFDTVSILLEDLGYSVTKAEIIDTHAPTQEKILKDILEAEKTNRNLVGRPPVIVVMGHVDHGKTKLLDAIRKTDIVAQEAGGITQSIGAYQVKHKGQLITFVDTPGHEAFTAMRSRGANIADLAILVVAADDGVKPQTIEAVSIMEKARLPFVVAINKIDKEGADIEKVKKGLSELNLIPEDWGGKTICVPVSAKAGTGIDDLLDMLLLLAEMDKDKIQANPERDAVGTIIESRIDKEIGPLATVLIQTGTLHIGDEILVSNIPGKIRSLKDWQGKNVTIAGPGMPVQILGLKGAAVVGDILQAGDIDKKLHKNKLKKYQTFGFIEMKKAEVENKKKKLPILVKADTLGSMEALIASLQKLDNSEVGVDIIAKDLGNISEKNLLQAKDAGAIIVGFNIDLTASARDESHGLGVIIHTSPIIYEILDFVKEKLSDLMPPEILFNKTGELKILKIFKTGHKNMIVGVRVEDGIINDQAIMKVRRSAKQIGEGKIVQLQHNKSNVSSLNKSQEGGLKFEGETRLEEGDILEAYEKVEKKRKFE